MKNGSIAGFGEVMLRLCPPGKKRFAQSLPGALEATFGGGEANFCASIAILGHPSCYLTALPDHPVSRAFAAELTGLGCDTTQIKYAKQGRMGVYFAEHGSNMRGSNVIYDRDNSTISLLAPADYDFAAMLQGVKHLHLTGITPSLSENAYLTTLALAQAAATQNITVSIDLNYRKKLWNWRPGTAKNALANECMTQILQFADIIIGNEEDAADVFGIHAPGSSLDEGKLNIEGYITVAAALAAKFPRAKLIATTLRESISADHNNWGGMLYDTATKQAHFAPLNAGGEYQPYEITDIVDRFGGGDSFCAGLIFALNHADYAQPEQAIKFAVAASALKHTVSGDYNYTNFDEVVSLVKGNTGGRVKR